MDFSRSGSVEKAELSPAIEAKLKSTFEKIYENLFEGALIRCDFFVLNSEVYLNEVNPIPGSMANYLFDDFKSSLELLASSLPTQRRAKTNYDYIHSISKAKGK